MHFTVEVNMVPAQFSATDYDRLVPRNLVDVAELSWFGIEVEMIGSSFDSSSRDLFPLGLHIERVRSDLDFYSS